MTASKSRAETQNYGNVDAVTRARAGSLAAHGLLDQQIADVLMLTIEQVYAAKNSDEYKIKYAEVAEEVIQRQIDLDGGWDLLEEKALASILDTLSFNRDPNYALHAARAANQAKRRAGSSSTKVIDNSGAGNKTNNIIILNLNKTFITEVQSTPNSAMIDVSPRVAPTTRRISDLPSPKSVDQLLAPVQQSGPISMKTELEEAFEVAGVFKDID